MRIRTNKGIEGEGDFVLAIPGRGFLILEVKGGSMEQIDGRWLQNGSQLKESPRDQALGYAKKLHTRLMEVGFQSVPYGVITIFPDTPFSFSPSQDDLSDLVIGAQDIPWLIESIQAKLDKAFPANYLVPQSNWIGGLHNLWGETWIPKLKLGHRAKLNADERLSLDADQVRLIDSLMDNTRLLVQGVAGSGKTLVAREAACKMAAQGKRVIYLCYTDALAEWMRPSLAAQGIDVFTVQRYAVRRLESSGLTNTSSKTPEYWANVSLLAAVEALPEETMAPDVLILDEAQDFTENDWVLIEELSREKTCWIFYDPAQAFWQDRVLPAWAEVGGRFKLTQCYRCPEAVIEYSKQVHGEDFDETVLKKGFDAGQIAVVDAPSESSILSRVEKEITKLRSEGFSPGDIAVLSLRGQTAKDGVSKLDNIGNFKIVRADDPSMADNIVGDTFLRFKGLERPAIIVTDLRLVNDRKDVRMHIALTRATDVLRVVGLGE